MDRTGPLKTTDAHPPADAGIAALLVLYRPNEAELISALEALAASRRMGVPIRAILWHNDEGPAGTPGLAPALDTLRRQGLPIHVSRGRQNLGFGRAINASLGHVSEPFILLLNQDAIPEPDSISRLWREAMSSDASCAAWEMRQIPYEHPKDYDPVTGETGWFSGAAVMLRTAALRSVGGFEPRFFMYCEDVDLSWRLRCAGWRLRYLPRCAVVHRTYDVPYQIKPLAALNGAYANLCLRTRYAGRRHVWDGVRQVWRAMQSPEPFEGHRAGLRRALLRFLLNYRYFRRTRQAAPGFQPHFQGWDYEMRREGAFVPFQSQQEQTQPRPLVSIIVRASGDPAALRDWLACIGQQTHEPLEVLVVGGTQPALHAVLAPVPSRHPVHALPDTAAPLEAIAAVHAQGDWWLTFRDDHLLPYADHTEVLLQSARAEDVDASVALTSVIHVSPGQRLAAHRLHAPRVNESADRSSRLIHRRGWIEGHAPRTVQVDKTTIVRYDSALT